MLGKERRRPGMVYRAFLAPSPRSRSIWDRCEWDSRSIHTYGPVAAADCAPAADSTSRRNSDAGMALYFLRRGS